MNHYSPGLVRRLVRNRVSAESLILIVAITLMAVPSRSIKGGDSRLRRVWLRCVSTTGQISLQHQRKSRNIDFRRPSGQLVSPQDAANLAENIHFQDKASSQQEWVSLFDGISLDGWNVTNFGGEGEVTVQEGRIVIDFGQMLTGITYQGDFPVSDYEIQWEGMRIDGIDFFCGLTFPVGPTHCTLIAGGWAGAVVGLSSIDDRDASENESTTYSRFENGRWYHFRVRVTDDRIRVWIDDRPMIDQPLAGRRMETRPEVDLSKPLGIAAWQSRAALRGISYRRLK